MIKKHEWKTIIKKESKKGGNFLNHPMERCYKLLFKIFSTIHIIGQRKKGEKKAMFYFFSSFDWFLEKEQNTILIFLSETIVSHLYICYKAVDKLSVYSSTNGGFSKHLVSFWIKIKAEYLEVGEMALKSHLLWDQLLSQEIYSDKIQWVYILNCVWYCLQLNQDWIAKRM